MTRTYLYACRGVMPSNADSLRRMPGDELGVGGTVIACLGISNLRYSSGTRHLGFVFSRTGILADAGYTRERNRCAAQWVRRSDGKTFMNIGATP